MPQPHAVRRAGHYSKFKSRALGWCALHRRNKNNNIIGTYIIIIIRRCYCEAVRSKWYYILLYAILYIIIYLFITGTLLLCTPLFNRITRPIMRPQNASASLLHYTTRGRTRCMALSEPAPGRTFFTGPRI